MKAAKILAILLLIFGIGYFLRVMFLENNVLTFGYDQARDAIVSQQILKGDFKIQGPPASVPGLFHGVLYYYVLAPAYFFGQGSPIIAAYWIAFINMIAVFIVFGLTYFMTKKTLPALLGSFLFAISFEATQYATWLSNPTIAVLSVPLIYLGLWLWIKEKKNYASLIVGLGLGVSIQAEIFLAYHLVPVIIWLFVSRKNIKVRELILFLAVLGITTSSMIIAQLKFGFTALEGIKALAVTSESLAYAKSIGDYFILYLNQIGRIFAFNSYPGNIGYGGGFVIGLIVYSFVKSRKVGEKISPELFLSSWLLSHVWVVTVGGTSTPFLMVGIGPAVSIIIALFLANLWQKKLKVITLLIVLILTFGNISMIMKENSHGSTLFSIQKEMLLSKQIEVVDYTYLKSGSKPFSINTLTSPLWINIVWTYVYKWYGLPKYGYLPSFHGRDQIGILDSLPKDEGGIKKYFLVLEPMGGIPMRYLEETVSQENSVSKLIGEITIGEMVVQEREAIKK